MATTNQQYCLRWNNHRSNLLTVFDELLRNEAFTDVTLACEGNVSVKCHKMVLAACSSYFQSLFTELPCRHPVVVLKDVKYSEMKAILEYMYRGEVNVAQDQLAALLKVAQTLKVKGLVEEREPLTSTPKRDQEPQNTVEEDPSSAHSPPNITTSLANPPPPIPHSSSSSASPPQSSGMPFDKNPYSLYGKSPVMERGSRMSLPMWAMPGLPFPHHPSPVPPPTHPGLLNTCYEAASSGSADMSPLKRKKLQSLLMSRDTPILRTVLGQGQVQVQGQGQGQGQGQADSSQPMALVCQSDSHERAQYNGAPQDLDKSSVKAETYEEARSPYTDISGVEDESGDKNNKIMMSQSFPTAVSSGIATYVPTQKPEWKRYKQYTRNDIMSAIEAVRTGMSALQAARKYGVPSRTLYDKVKKMGITTSRPFNKRVSSAGSGGSSYFPYSGGGSSMFAGETDEQMQNQPPGMMEPLFLQHALDGMKREMGEREVMSAMKREIGEREAMVAAAHVSTHSGASSSPGENGRSPSPCIKYHNSLTPSPDDERDDDQVEDLSVARKPEPMRVIVPLISQQQIMKKDDGHLDDPSHSEESRNNSLETAERD